jgi:hypothetical protein
MSKESSPLPPPHGPLHSPILLFLPSPSWLYKSLLPVRKGLIEHHRHGRSHLRSPWLPGNSTGRGRMSQACKPVPSRKLGPCQPGLPVNSTRRDPSDTSGACLRGAELGAKTSAELTLPLSLSSVRSYIRQKEAQSSQERAHGTSEMAKARPTHRARTEQADFLLTATRDALYANLSS